MSFYLEDIEDLIKRTLREYNLYSDSAVNLLLGTLAQESGFGKYLKQLGGGPALSGFQIERPTFNWLKHAYMNKYNLQEVEFEELEWNLKLAILFCRLRYFVVPSPLPAADDIKGLAEYWKNYYNTYLGKGKIEEFIANYKKYVNKN